jgi:hypothetical protein
MLTVRKKRNRFEPKLPYAVFIDGLYAGMLKDDKLQLEIPNGSYQLRVQFGGRIPIGKSGKSIDASLSASKQIDIPQGRDIECLFYDRERLWNILFDIDLVVWVVSWFVEMPSAYKIISDAFFAVWLLRLVIIRKKYYRIEVS